MIAALLAASLLPLTGAAPTADGGTPAPTIVCTVNAGIPGGSGTPDGHDRLDCLDIMACVVIDGISGVDGAPAAVRLVVCQSTQ